MKEPWNWLEAPAVALRDDDDQQDDGADSDLPGDPGGGPRP